MDTRDHSGATARMLAKQYGHMKVVGLIDALTFSAQEPLPEPRYLCLQPGLCWRCLLPWAEVGEGPAQLRMGGQVGRRSSSDGVALALFT